jgi:hypothetical protein
MGDRYHVDGRSGEPGEAAQSLCPVDEDLLSLHQEIEFGTLCSFPPELEEDLVKNPAAFSRRDRASLF